MKIKILHLPDLHVGCPKVKACNIYENLVDFVYPKLFDGVNLLVIGGDFFDTLLNMNSDSGYFAGIIINELKNIAIANNIYIRVLRGTYSHDRKQNRFFLIDAPSSKELIKVVENIQVDLISELGISLLFIPDDLPYSDVPSAARSVLAESSLDKVDFVITHGYYDHLLPLDIPVRPNGTYTDTQFDDIVLGAVLNGHIHSARSCGKVFTGGSFERFAHGEEDPKGFITLEYDTVTHKVVYKFNVNEKAAIFKTINLSKCDNIDSAMETFSSELDNVLESDKSRGDIHIRVISNDPSIRQAVVNLSRNKTKYIHLSYKRSDVHTDRVVKKYNVSDLPVITEDNLSEHVVAFLEKENIHIDIEDVNSIL